MISFVNVLPYFLPKCYLLFVATKESENEIHSRARFQQTFFCKAKSLLAHSIWQKNISSISPTIKTPNYKLKLTHFSPNLFAI